MSDHQYRYSSDMASEETMFNDLEKILAANNIAGKLANDLKLAVSEAFTNAMVHGNRLEANKNVTINISINNDLIIADIIDEGTGDPGRVSKTEDPELWQERGRGVILMETMADRVSFQRDHISGGLQCTLMFVRKRYDNIKQKSALKAGQGG